jgi:hypothetical protein
MKMAWFTTRAMCAEMQAFYVYKEYQEIDLLALKNDWLMSLQCFIIFTLLLQETISALFS